LVKYTVTALFGLSFLLVLALSEAVFCIKFKVLAALIDVFVVFCISVFLAFPQKTSAILFEYIGTRNPAQCRSHNQKIEILKKKIYKYKKNVIKFKHKATQVDEIEIAIDTSPSFLW
jgi:hypothetical protein